KKHLRNLHQLRNIVQHQADVPSYDMILKYKNYVEAFFKKIYLKEFKIDFSALSLASLIKHKKFRKNVKKAEEHFEKKAYEKSIAECLTVFNNAIKNLNFVYKAGYLLGHFSVPMISLISEKQEKEYYQQFEDKEVQKLAKDFLSFLKDTIQSVTTMQFLGDLRGKCSKFLEISALPENKLTKEDAHFSLDFIITFILRWEESGLFHSSLKNNFE
ncbi:hypothetical protein KAX03_03475, partial [Candidatus Bathyarchaeota archaeon]|nr:hypothetical protein [Candidatus Bathyarchaeota archaeon]